MRHPRRLQLAQVTQQRARRTGGGAILRADPKTLERLHGEVLRECLRSERGVELPWLALGRECAQWQHQLGGRG